MTKILNCDCKHDFQDSKYGAQKRVHTVSGDGKKAFCTVCAGRNKNKVITGEPAAKYKHIGMVFSTTATIRRSKNI